MSACRHSIVSGATRSAWSKRSGPATTCSCSPAATPPRPTGRPSSRERCVTTRSPATSLAQPCPTSCRSEGDSLELTRTRRPEPPPGPYLVAGLGRAGLSACRALAARDGADQVRGWASEIPPPLAGAVEQLRGAGVRIETGGDGVEFLRAGPAPRCLVKSPGIPPWAPLLTSAAEAGVVIMDELELGWRLSTAPLIAV